MYNEKNSAPAFAKGFLWFVFSGTATLSVFILPIHIWALSHGHKMNTTPLSRIYFLILFVAALYHGLYRVKTTLFDLGFIKQQKMTGVVSATIFIIASSSTAYLLFFLI